MLCELAFQPVPEGWDPTVLGLFRSRMEGTLPQRENLTVFGAAVRHGTGQVTQLAPATRMRFRSRDRKRVAQLSDNVLTVNVLAPHPHWAEVRKFIFECLAAYREAGRPAGISRATLRYIDRVTGLPGNGSPLGAWFDCGGSLLPERLIWWSRARAATRRSRSTARSPACFGVSP